MSTEISVSKEFETPLAATSDGQLIEVWLHGRPVHTQRAYRADIGRFLAGAKKPLPTPAMPTNTIRALHSSSENWIGMD